jgi:hypothetical protein
MGQQLKPRLKRQRRKAYLKRRKAREKLAAAPKKATKKK